MYHIKPVLERNLVQELPDCMYSLKAVNKGCQMESKNNFENNKYADLEERQKRILEQLEVLKQTLLSMRDGVKSSPVLNQKLEPIDTSLLTDFVINANPQNIPYSLLALKNLWKDRLNIVFEVFIHSTVENYQGAAKQFSDSLTKSSSDNKIPTLNVTLIWKNVDVTQMISSLANYSPIYGEANIIRYLSRVGPKEYNYDQSDNIYQSNLDDIVLDICYILSKKLSPKDRQSYIQQLNQRLGKQKFFNESNLSVVDVAVSSTLKQLNLKSDKDLPGNLAGWLARVSILVGY